MTDVLVISGPAGVGKTSVAIEVAHQLAARGIAHTLIDTDELDRIFPVPHDLPAVTERNLAAMWRTFSERGADVLVLAGVFLDRDSELTWIARAVPHARFTLVRLMASEETLLDRVRQRELGSGLDAQIARTRDQLGVMQRDTRPSVHTLTVDHRSVGEAAAHILSLWLPLEPAMSDSPC